WGIAYVNTPFLGGNPVTLAFVNRAGTLIATEIPADLSGQHGSGFQPRIAGDGRVFGVTWFEFAGSTSVMAGSFFAFQNSLLTSLAGTLGLSAIEPGATANRNHFTGAIETDGDRFTYTYTEQRANSADFDVFAATIDPITGAF